MSKRAERRHHYQRLKKNRSHYWGGDNCEGRCAVLANTPTPCSCYMCGNPRKYFKEVTRKEKQFNNHELEES